MGGFRSNIRFSTPRLNLLLACSILLLASTTGCSISKIRRSWSKDATRIESPQPENDEPAPSNPMPKFIRIRKSIPKSSPSKPTWPTNKRSPARR